MSDEIRSVLAVIVAIWARCPECDRSACGKTRTDAERRIVHTHRCTRREGQRHAAA